MVKTKKVGVYYNLLENKDKIYYFNYRDATDGKLKWVKVGSLNFGCNEQLAVELRAEQIAKMRLGEDAEIVINKKNKNKKIITLDSLAQIYFEDKKIGKDRISKYKIYIYPKFGNKDILAITKKQIEKFLAGISDSGKANQTVNGIRELFSAMINHNIKQKNLKYINPLVGIPRLKVDNDRERYLSLDEIKELKETIKDKPLLLLFVNLSLVTGARLESMMTLQKKDFNLSNLTVTIKNHKTNETYTGFLKSSMTNDLKEYLNKLNVNDYVVSLEDNKKLTQRVLRGRLQLILNNLFNAGLDTKMQKIE